MLELGACPGKSLDLPMLEASVNFTGINDMYITAAVLCSTIFYLNNA